MDPKCLVLWGSEPGVGRRTVSQALAAQLAVLEPNVVFVRIDRDAEITAKSNLTHWLPQFKMLAPVLLRNYLKPACDRYARLELSSLPSAAQVATLVSLLKQAF